MTYTLWDTPFRNQQYGVGSYLLNGLHLGLREALRSLPYQRRMGAARKLGRLVLSAHKPYRQRIEENLNLIFPHSDPAWRAKIRLEVGEAMGQSLAEHMSMRQFAEGAASLQVSGPGLASLDASRGAILVTGHFGQWEAVRLGWRQVTGSDCGLFFRPHNNGFWDRHWQRYLIAAGSPLVPKGGPGREMMEEHLASKGTLLMLIDQAVRSAPRFDFLGQPARTSPRAAQMAVKYDLPFIAAFARRASNGIDCEVTFLEPISATTPEQMTADFNASLAEQVRAAPGQYLWTHRRWR